MTNPLRRLDRWIYDTLGKGYDSGDIENAVIHLCPENADEVLRGWKQWKIGIDYALVFLITMIVCIVLWILGRIFFDPLFVLGAVLFVVGIIGNTRGNSISDGGKTKHYYESGICDSPHRYERWARRNLLEKGLMD